MTWHEPVREFRQLAEATSDAVLLCDSAGVITFASRAVADFGYSPENLRGVRLADLVHPEDLPSGARALRWAVASTATRAGRYPFRIRAADGTWRHVETSMQRYRDPGGPDRLLVTARDLSSQVALRRQVTHLTFHDGLTGLPNRAYIEQRARDVLPQARTGRRHIKRDTKRDSRRGTVGVIVLGIGGLAQTQDSAGRAAGELLLSQVARRLRLAVSPQDTVARWDGTEFAVLVEAAAGGGEIIELARRLAASVSSPSYHVGDAEMSLTVSVGVAMGDDSPAGRLWREAEEALAVARESGNGEVEVAGDCLAS